LPIAPKPGRGFGSGYSFGLVMARPSKEPPHPSTLVPAIVRYAGAHGLDVEALAWRFGLPAEAARLDAVTTGTDVPDELLQSVARAAAAPDVALRLAADLSSRTHTLAELAVRAMTDVAAALGALARWVGLLHPGLYALVEVDAEEMRWVLSTPHRPRGVGRYVHELALAYALLRVRDGAGDVALRRVWFTHSRPPDLDGLRAFFGSSDLAFGCETSGFALGRSEADRVMRLADPRTVDAIAPMVEAEVSCLPRGAALAERIEAHLVRGLPDGADVAEVARAVHMSARTLQRRLEQENTRFSEVLDRARFRLSRGLLSDPTVTLADVAFRLGFADLATFSRAFKRWTGQPPGQWRRS
jgi:AraC-like DNA-binding protein